MSEPATLPDLLSEQEAYDRFSHVLEDKELRRARRDGAIGFYRRKGRILYREDELVAFIAARLDESYTPPGSPAKAAPREGRKPFIEGMTPELMRAGSELLMRRDAPKVKAKPSVHRRSVLQWTQR